MKKRNAQWQVITARIRPDQYAWLRQEATRLGLEDAHRADASEIIRRLIDAEMSRGRSKS